MKADPPDPVQELDTEPVTPTTTGPPPPAADGKKRVGRRRNGVSPGSSLEAPMAKDARAQKLAEVRLRLESGAYNSRDMIERVVDRLLDKWNLFPPNK